MNNIPKGTYVDVKLKGGSKVTGIITGYHSDAQYAGYTVRVTDCKKSHLSYQNLLFVPESAITIIPHGWLGAGEGAINYDYA